MANRIVVPLADHPADPERTKDASMDDHDHSDNVSRTPAGSFWTSRTFFFCLAFLAIAGFFLISEHRAHALGALPFLFLLACPFMHMFMHGGHGNHGAQRDGIVAPQRPEGDQK